MAKTTDARSRLEALTARPEPERPRSWLGEIYHSAVGKKYAMAISGIVLMGYVVLHSIGNLKLYMGESSMNEYGRWIRIIGEPFVPEYGLLWIVRVVLLVAFPVHIIAAYQLTRMNRRARPTRYQSKRDYVVADFASRTMRWTGVIVGLFVLWHVADITLGYGHPDFEYGEVYRNVVLSFQRVPVALIYIVGNLALAIHLYHGAWSMFQTMGWNRPRFNHWRRWFAIALAAFVGVVNLSFPIAVLTGIIA